MEKSHEIKLLELEVEMNRLFEENKLFECAIFRKKQRALSKLAILNNDDIVLHEKILEVVNDSLIGNLLTEKIGGIYE